MTDSLINLSFDELVRRVRACQICAGDLPHEPRPVIQLSESSRILVVGQAPGRRVHETGLPFNDPSGDRLRQWMGITRDTFYDEQKLAILPMGFCYPGKGKSGDLPPRPECAPLWHESLINQMPNLTLTVLIGQYAQNYYLGNTMKRNLTETVKHYQEYLPDYFVLPHPSPRNRFWLSKNPWFEEEVLSDLREKVSESLDY